MDNGFLMGALSPRELIFLGTGATAFALGAVLLHAKGRLVSTRAKSLVNSLAAALFVSGAVLAHAGF